MFQGTHAPAREPTIKIIVRAVVIFHSGLYLGRQISLQIRAGVGGSTAP